MAKAAEKVRVAPRAVGKYLVQIVIVFAAYFVAGKLGQATTNIRSSNLGPVWPAYGIALAAVLLCGYRVWIGVAAGAFLVAFLSPVPYAAAVGQSAGATLAALTGASLLRIVNFHSSLSRLRDALELIVLGAFGSATVSASIGVSVLYATHVPAYSGLGSAWLIYWLGDSTGVLLVTPLVLALPNLLRSRVQVHIPELAALLLLLTATCLIVFGDLPLLPIRLHVLAFAVLPFVMWAAARFGVSGATLSTLFVATIATVGTAFGCGPFAQNTPFINAVLLDVFFIVLSVSGMALAAVIAEREQAEHDRELLVREQAAMEARLRLATIVESSDDAIIGTDIDGIIKDWNNGAERLYGHSAREVIGKSLSLLMPPDLCGDFPEIMAKLMHGDTISHHETIRQKKDGTRIEVSLTVSPIKDTKGEIVGSSVIGRDISERKRQEAFLRESEERLRLAVEAGRMYVFQWDPATDLIVRSGEGADILSWMDDPSHDSRKQFVARVHPDDRERYTATTATDLIPENPTYQTSYRVLRPDGQVIWIEESGRAFFDAQGRMLRMVGMAADATERKRAEEAVSSVSRRLIEAQEQERTRIARDLHDDINQQLALLAIEMEQLKQHPPESASEVADRMGVLSKRTREIAADIQSISHHLHSSKLEHLGLVPAIRGFCKEFSEQQEIAIDFTHEEIPSAMPHEVSLCLFRILQEGLHNSAKHSGARHLRVRLWGAAGEIHLMINDSGEGFDREAARKSRGLGLISMEERVRLVEGTLSIASKPGEGTTIHARVPLSSGTDSMRAAV